MFDEADAGVAEVESELAEHLTDVRKLVKGGNRVVYVSVNKDSHLLEIPEVCSCLDMM